MYRNGQYVAPPTATINSTLDFTVQNVTPITSLNNDRFTFSGSVNGKYAQAIIDTVKMTGFMSLKNDDHSISGQNAAANKRILKEAVETRKAADVLIASGAIILHGVWSNGIYVRPGEGFARIDRSIETKRALDIIEKNQAKGRAPRKARKPSNVQAIVAATEAAYCVEGASCEMRWDANRAPGAACEWAPAPAHIIICSYDVDAPVSKPRYRVPLAIMQAACGIVVEEPVQPVTIAPPGYPVSAKATNGMLAAEWRCIHKRAARVAAMQSEIKAATVAQLQDVIGDEVDDEIDAIISGYIGYDVAAG